jgi:hypothetical protein
MTGKLQSWLLAACAAVGFGVGCTDGSPTQVLTGKLSANSGAVAVRAVSGDHVVTAGRVHSDGSFTLSIPAGKSYRLEVLSSDGRAHPMLANDGGLAKNLAFDVCKPTRPYDMGNCELGGTGTGGMCVPPKPCMDPTDPNCQPCDPNSGMSCPCDPAVDPTCKPPCDPTLDPMCKCDPSTGMCPPCDPTDPMCKQPCDPMTDPMCPPPCDPTDPMCKQPCDPTVDPMCKCDPITGMCPPCDPTDPMCKQPCDPMTDPMCGTTPPPCTNPMDPTTCKDPCMTDPSMCACSVVVGSGSGSGYMDGKDPGGMGSGSCWPPPEMPCDMNGNCTCDGGGMFPTHPPVNFGCGEPKP